MFQKEFILTKYLLEVQVELLCFSVIFRKTSLNIINISKNDGYSRNTASKTTHGRRCTKDDRNAFYALENNSWREFTTYFEKDLRYDIICLYSM
jgi:hypothetical protein